MSPEPANLPRCEGTPGTGKVNRYYTAYMWIVQYTWRSMWAQSLLILRDVKGHPGQVKCRRRRRNPSRRSAFRSRSIRSSTFRSNIKTILQIFQPMFRGFSKLFIQEKKIKKQEFFILPLLKIVINYKQFLKFKSCKMSNNLGKLQKKSFTNGQRGWSGEA